MARYTIRNIQERAANEPNVSPESVSFGVAIGRLGRDVPSPCTM
ncbi:hypothetical protein ACNKU7_09375 [Microbulbifer sp. SA54]